MKVENINIFESIENAKKQIASDKSLSPSVRSTIDLLILIITLLCNRRNLNSNNSSIPPSKNPLGTVLKKKKKKRKGKRRKKGGQNGHKGKTLEKIENPDEVEVLEIDLKSLPKGTYHEVGYDIRQTVEITVSRHVKEYQAQILENEKGEQYVAEFPNDVKRPIQYGASLKAHSVYMSQFQLVPIDRIRDHFTDQMGIPISTGTIANFNKKAYDLLEAFESITIEKLIASNRNNADETGINVDGKRIWLHSVSNDLWTIYMPHIKRGTEAMNAMGILSKFKGRLCHDHWKPYYTFEDITHCLCNAHHLRELERAWEQDGQTWAKNMQKFLCDARDAVEKAGGALSKKEAKRFLKRYRNILTRGGKECPSPNNTNTKGRVKKSTSRNLLERLRDFEEDTLRFMTEKDVPFTNNLGESDIRMTKVQQKISGCFRSMEGAKIFCRNRGYLSTCRKHGVGPSEALKILFEGRLPDFVYQKE